MIRKLRVIYYAFKNDFADLGHTPFRMSWNDKILYYWIMWQRLRFAKYKDSRRNK